MIKYSFRVSCFLWAVFLFASCSKIHFIEFEPIYVKANAPGTNVFRGSYNKTTDIIHTHLNISFNWDSAFAYGEAEILAQPYFYPSDSVVLDAKGFSIKGVQLKDSSVTKNLTYTYKENKLNIKLDKVYKAGEQFTLKVDYIAMPQKLKVGKDISSSDDRGMYFINPENRGRKPQQIWTQGETENNSAWFPTIEDPAEKMTHQFNIKVENRFKTLSNGFLKESIRHKDGTRTDSWVMDQPHAVYLSMLAIGEFDIVKDSWNGKDLNYYMEPKYSPYAKSIFGNTPQMLSYYSDLLNYPFPWKKYDQAVVRNFLSGAMENTTASLFYDGLNMTDAEHEDNNQDDIIAHELFHHWFGNLVTCESWANLSLNESFATYGEFLWREHKNGRDDADHYLMQDARSYFDYAKIRDEDVIRYDYADKEQMFDAITYQKGSVILHNLRTEIGDDAFFKSLNLYLNRYAYKTAEIHDLRLVFEEITGRDLNWYFNQWFMASGTPQLKIEKYYHELEKKVIVKVTQQQDTTDAPLYHLPIKIKIVSGGQIQIHNVVVDSVHNQYNFSSVVKPDYIKFDVNNNLLIRKEEIKGEQDYLMQLKYADNFYDRYEASRYFNDNKANAYSLMVLKSALEDKSWFIIYIGLTNFKFFDQAFINQSLGTIKQLALNHPKSLIRAEAVKILKKHYSKKVFRELRQQLKDDKSLMVKKALK